LYPIKIKYLLITIKAIDILYIVTCKNFCPVTIHHNWFSTTIYQIIVC
jgi:hypothetical protein